MPSMLLTKSILTKLTSTVCKFWWTRIQEDNASRPLCFRAWEEFCKQFSEGGLGIRYISLMNLALIAMAIWRLIKEPTESYLPCYLSTQTSMEEQIFGS